MGLISRIKMIFTSKANAGLDKIEDAVQMTQQAIRDLKEKLDNAIKAQATFKSMISGLKAEKRKLEASKIDWSNKAEQLQLRIDAEPEKSVEYESLIIVAIENSEKAGVDAEGKTSIINGYESKYNAMVVKIKELRELIVDSENNLTQLKARQDVANASVAVNKELNNISGLDSTKELMKRMEAKITSQEHLADAYEGIDEDNKTNEDKINDVLKNTSSVSSAEKLAAFRANRNKA